ncbi:MAG: hypothetical protein NTY70_09310 [Burkholderiales bacterium]|nr:hypothetical protein [Burkholderiales bacterium]
MKHQLPPLGSATALALSLSLIACGSGSSYDTPNVTPTPSGISYDTIINDGLIKGAIACLDINLNGKCDTNEPTSAKSDANGKATILVPVGTDGTKFPILVEVPADAVDADNPTGTVGTAYTLSAPAGKTGYISPLTTMVHTYLLQNPTAGLDAAVAAVKEQLKLSGSPLDNIVGKTDDDSLKAADAGRVLVKIKQAHLDDLKTLMDSDSSLSKAQVEALLNKRLLELLASLQEKLKSGKLSLADLAAAVAEIKELTHIDKDSLKDALEDDKNHGEDKLDVSALTAGASVRWFSYANSLGKISYFVRQFVVTDDDIKDAATTGRYFYTDRRYQMIEDIKKSSGNDWVRSEVYFTGTAWFPCPADFKNTATVRNAAGENFSIYCDAVKSKTVRTVKDISGKNIKDVITEIRKFPYADVNYGSYKFWGADPATAGLDVAFVAGSKLFYHITSEIENPLSYSSLSEDKMLLGAPTGTQELATTLDDMISSYPLSALTDGVYIGGRNSLHFKTITLGTAADPILDTSGGKTGTVSFYPLSRYRVAFNPTEKQARIYRCKVVANDTAAARYVKNSSYGCTSVSDTAYKIETKADARVLSFAKMPDELIPLWRNDRVYVERDSNVMLGGRARLDSNRELRLNGVAMDQLRGILNIN